ncbi:MAG TPA: hypothetical protein VHB47_21590 [Thermoanaerobaculia bacterium]|jgi:hypothetical protein|nr:hypothetical protein [Thermoanaerobaculia bacterium]
MRWQRLDRSTVLRRISAAILIGGLAAAIVIYANAGPAPEYPLGSDLEDSKVYLRQLELYGGKANVLAVELRQWFDGLWHGRSLAFTVAVLAALVAAGFRLAAIPLPPLDDADDAGGGQPSRDGGGPGADTGR